MSEPLWSDERMKKREDEIDNELYSIHGGNTRPWQHYMEVWQTIAYEMRDEYEARIAQLESEKEEKVETIDMEKWRAFGEKLRREKQERLERKRKGT